MSYEDFYNKWKKEYKDNQDEIKICCKKLGSVSNYAIYQSAELETDIKNLIKEEWFYERVYDTYLWHAGL